MAARVIVGRPHQRFGNPRHGHCARRSSVGSHDRTVLQRWHLNDCHHPAEKQREKLVDGAWFYCDEPAHPAIPGPRLIYILPKHAIIQTRLLMMGTYRVNVKMAMADGGGHNPVQYQDYLHKVWMDIQAFRVPSHAIGDAEWTRDHTPKLQHKLEEIICWQCNYHQSKELCNQNWIPHLWYYTKTAGRHHNCHTINIHI